MIFGLDLKQKTLLFTTRHEVDGWIESLGNKTFSTHHCSYANDDSLVLYSIQKFRAQKHSRTSGGKYKTTCVSYWEVTVAEFPKCLIKSLGDKRIKQHHKTWRIE